MINVEDTWWLTEDQSARVKDGDPRARWLLVFKGQPFDDERLKAIPELEPLPPVEGKAIDAPPATKAIRHPKTKADV